MFKLVFSKHPLPAGQILLNEATGELQPVVQYSTPPPPAPPPVPVGKPEMTPQYRVRVVANRRKHYEIEQLRERLVTLISERPKGVPVKELALRIYGNNYARHQYNWVADDCDRLAEMGSITRSKEQDTVICFPGAAK